MSHDQPSSLELSGAFYLAIWEANTTVGGLLRNGMVLLNPKGGGKAGLLFILFYSFSVFFKFLITVDIQY